MSRLSILAVLTFLFTGCTLSSHAVRPSGLGTRSSTAELVASLAEPGPLQVETVLSADWSVERSGLINLEHPRAKEAGLQDGDEPIHIFFHVLRHPTRGTFIVDTGVEQAYRDAPEKAAVRGFVASAAKLDRMKVHRALGDWQRDEGSAPAGVFLTHLHLDHVLGLPDLPEGTPVHAGPGETKARAFLNLFVRGPTNRTLSGKGDLEEWPFAAGGGDEALDGVVDVFGDRSLWAIWVPGHTSGSTAYLARTAEGPVLFLGDACHTAWGWENDVEPGTFSADLAQSARSLARLRALVAAHPEIQVRLGHQHLR